MKKVIRLGVAVLAASIALGIGLKSALAQDPFEVGPEHYALLLENEKVRVAEFKFAPGDSMGMHSHPDHVVYILSGGTLQLSYPDGTTKDIAGNPGDVLWGAAESHATANTGTTEVRGIIIELKEATP